MGATTLVQIGTAAKRLIRVFPRRTKASPDDALAYFTPPDLFAEADEVHVDVTFTADKDRAEQLAESWKHVAPVKLGGVAYEDPGRDFVPGKYIKHGYTFTSRGCPRRWRRRRPPVRLRVDHVPSDINLGPVWASTDRNPGSIAMDHQALLRHLVIAVSSSGTTNTTVAEGLSRRGHSDLSRS